MPCSFPFVAATLAVQCGTPSGRNCSHAPSNALDLSNVGRLGFFRRAARLRGSLRHGIRLRGSADLNWKIVTREPFGPGTRLRLFGTATKPLVRAPAHSLRLPGKRHVKIGGATEFDADRLCAMDGPQVRRFPLALIPQLMAVATGEESTTQVQDRHAPSTAARGTVKPGPRSTVMAWCPFEADSVFQIRKGSIVSARRAVSDLPNDLGFSVD